MTRMGSLDIVIDGSFGSTGKGLLSGYIADNTDYDFACTNAAPNAGHTHYHRDQKIVAHHLSIVGIVQRVPTYIGPGSIIDVDMLEKEIQDYDMHDLVVVHPRAAVVADEDIKLEHNISSGAARIASTQKGVGAALARKVARTASLAGDNKRLIEMGVIQPSSPSSELRHGMTGILEIPQGLGLGINSGYSYPYCTSREISVAQGMADVQVHPSFIGEIHMSMRSFPIRVGNIVGDDGKEIGYSGPFWSDSKEVTWAEIGVEPELTTVTKRVRRVATFSELEFRHALQEIQPTTVFMNFMQYVPKNERRKFIDRIKALIKLDCPNPVRILWGWGPRIKDVGYEP